MSETKVTSRTVLVPPSKTPQFPIVSTSNMAAQDSNVDFPYSTKTAPHLLAIPLEIRQRICELLVTDQNQHRAVEWFKKSTFKLAGLQLSCGQLNDEIKTFKLRDAVPYFNFPELRRSVVDDLKHDFALTGQRYRSMTIQFSLEAPSKHFGYLAQTLEACAPALEELHLSFTGADSYTTPVYLHGCAYSPKIEEAKLPEDGQLRREMSQLQIVLMKMTKLRILVVSNMNFQIFPAVFRHKPNLQYVHLTADPRSITHLAFKSTNPLLLASRQWFPPLKVLHISANSMFGLALLPNRAAHYLEHLTWTIPPRADTNRAEDMIYKLEEVLRDLAQRGSPLKTLRICFGYTTDRGNVTSILHNAITNLGHLREFDLHLQRVSSYDGDTVLRGLPHGLERFHTTDKLVSPMELHRFIRSKYLTATLTPRTRAVIDPEIHEMSNWIPVNPQADLSRDFSPEDEVRELGGEVFISLDAATGRFLGYSEHQLANEVSIQRNIGQDKRGAKFHDDFAIIGEDYRRNDYIPLSTGDLKFVSYEFGNPDHWCATGPEGETLTQMVLRLNGRLLDRSRNMHLRNNGASRHIPPKTDNTFEVDKETQYHSTDLQYAMLLHQLHEDAYERLRKKKAVLNVLQQSSLKDDERYFGNEEEAEEIFRRERVARVEDLEPLTYPYYVDYDSGDHHYHCHWTAPEASVPTLVEIYEAEREEAERQEAEQRRYEAEVQTAERRAELLANGRDPSGRLITPVNSN